MFLTLVKITPVDAYINNSCYCMDLRVSVYLHMCMIIYTVIVHSSRLYMMLIGYVNYMVLGVLVMCACILVYS